MKYLIFCFLSVYCIFGFSQESYIVVNQDSISINKFKKDYQNNIEAEGLQNAIDTYVNFQLLQQAASKSHVDTTKVFHKIYAQAIQPEIENYLYNPTVKEKMVDEIWKNLQTDRKILIYANGVSNPYDLKNKEERKLLTNDLHQHVCHNQPATKRVLEYKTKNNEKKFWVRPMHSSAEIEKVAYQTPIGKCSDIHTSENGFFFVKVLEERPSTGIITLDYIFNPKKEELVKAYNNLNENQAWQDVKKSYHVRKSSQSIPEKQVFNVDIPEEFIDAIDHLNEHSISQPIEGSEGFYIIKLFKQEKFDHLEKWRNWIEKRILESDYALNYVRFLEDKSSQVVNLTEDSLALSEVINQIGDKFFADKKDINLSTDKVVWSTGKLSFSQQDLIKELHYSRKFLDEKTNTKVFLEDILPKFKQHLILNTYRMYLEDYEPKFAEKSNILKQAILVNHFIDTEIYDKAERDSIGLQNYLNNHLADYTWPVRYELEIYRYKTNEEADRIIKMLKKKKTSEEILATFSGKKADNGALSVAVTRGKFTLNGSDTPENLNPNKKIQKLTYRNGPAIVKVVSKLKRRPKTISEAGQSLKEAFKTYQYNQTLKNLRKDATISIPPTL